LRARLTASRVGLARFGRASRSDLRAPTARRHCIGQRFLRAIGFADAGAKTRGAANRATPRP